MSVMKDLLLIHSFNLSALIEEYRVFFLSLLPSVFILAVFVEYFDRLGPFSLVKRALISILILTTITSFYHQAIDLSLESADEILSTQKSKNILLMDMLDGNRHWKDLLSEGNKRNFIKEEGVLSGSLSFLKHHLFTSFINDSFTVTVYFITQLCFVILKVVYSLVYYLGYGLIGIPCLIYIFPSMGNVLRGAITSFLWCLTVPHVLVFVLSLIGSEINKGYSGATIIGGSVMGTALLFVMTLFIAFTPLIAMMILNGSGVAQAGGVISTVGGNYVMNLPKNTVSLVAAVMGGKALGPVFSLLNQVAHSKAVNPLLARHLKSRPIGHTPSRSSGKSHLNRQNDFTHGQGETPNRDFESLRTVSTSNKENPRESSTKSTRETNRKRQGEIHPSSNTYEKIPRATRSDSGHRKTYQENNADWSPRKYSYSRPWGKSSSNRKEKR